MQTCEYAAADRNTGTPPSYAWNALTGAKGHCIQRDAQLFTNSAFNIAADFVVLLLPIPKFLHLTMSRGKKAGVLVTFLVRASSTHQLYITDQTLGRLRSNSRKHNPARLPRTKRRQDFQPYLGLLPNRPMAMHRSVPLDDLLLSADVAGYLAEDMQGRGEPHAHSSQHAVGEDDKSVHFRWTEPDPEYAVGW